MSTVKDRSDILVVEDEAVLMELLVSLLDAEGYRCISAASCADARKAAKNTFFKCCLVDLGLPDGRGLDLLPEFKEANPWMVPIILTGDAQSDSVIETMRAGAFDYLCKPVDLAQLKAAVGRAMDHHEAIRERDRLVELLSEEKAQLKQKVDAATQGIRAYAEHCETISARLHSLLRLTQASEDLPDEERLFSKLFEELDAYVPITCAALCSANHEAFVAIVRKGKRLRFIDERAAVSGGTHAAAGASKPRMSNRGLIKHHTGLDLGEAAFFEFPQSSWGHPTCVVSFLLAPDFETDEASEEFLSMCAHFLASTWLEGRLFQHAARQASVGNIAMELSNGFIQGLTAIRTVADFVSETEISAEAAEGLEIIFKNVEDLKRQIQEFRQLSAQREGAVETVRLNKCIDQALAMLSMTIQGRAIEIKKNYNKQYDCLLVNGTVLARTFLDLISNAVRTVEAGGQVLLRLTETDDDGVVFEIGHNTAGGEGLAKSQSANGYALPDELSSHPRFVLAQRSIRSCGGRLVYEHKHEGRFAYRVFLPKNTAKQKVEPEAAE